MVIFSVHQLNDSVYYSPSKLTCLVVLYIAYKVSDKLRWTDYIHHIHSNQNMDPDFYTPEILIVILFNPGSKSWLFEI